MSGCSCCLPALIALLMVMGGCGSSSSAKAGSHGRGDVHLQLVSTAAIPRHVLAAGGGPRSDPGLDFDLGEVGATSKFFFLLQNTGIADATNVVLSSDDENVVISPANIAVIHPAGAGGITPLVQVEILHGWGPNQVGERTILDPGLLQFTVTAASDQDTASAVMGASILVADYTINGPGGALPDYAHDVGGTYLVGEEGFVTDMYQQGQEEYVATVPHTDLTPGELTLIDAAQSELSVTNTGNCPLRIICKATADTRTPMAEAVIVPAGQTRTIACQATYDDGNGVTAEDVFVEVHAEAMFSQALHAPYRMGAQIIYAWCSFIPAPPG